MPTFRNTLFHLHRQVDVSDSTHIYLPMKMEETDCSETSAYKLHTPGNYPKESIQHTEHGESLKSRMNKINKIRILSWDYLKTMLQTIVCHTDNKYLLQYIHFSSSFYKRPI
jgi:hypothetical protein